ncbi:MAG: helix-turn-helix domain-containing protein, partial [Trichodesmium sp. St2_bin2_1]|nr:helix-turn-helix domain-containing protein [Trichodesmium sp. St2_bin2_1]
MAKNYVTPGEAARILGVCDRTLRYWEEQGKITAIRTAGGQRRYDITTYTTGTTGNRV